jgi:tetratricopeptide (TPR) repeat protein
MRRGLSVLAGLLALPLYPAAVGAGIYTPGAPASRKALDPPYRQIGKPAAAKDVLAGVEDLRLLDDLAAGTRQGPPSTLRVAYLSFVDGLEKRRSSGTGLTTTEYASLGGCLLRLGRWSLALAVLEEGLRRAPASEPARFLLHLNMAEACRNNPELLPRALDSQRQALATWPARWTGTGWGREEWAWYRRAEKFDLVLLQHRQREALQGAPAEVTLDPLFPRVRWVGPSGHYEAGALAVEQLDELPPDAEPLVVQLMLWEPSDTRLLWLYGELLNARGQVPAAFEVLDQCARRGLSGELREHRKVLWQAKPAYDKAASAAEQQALVAQAAPVPAETRPPEGPPRAAAPVLPDWRTLLVGFAVGCLVTLLGVFQWRQLRRRRDAESPGRVAHAPGEP